MTSNPDHNEDQEDLDMGEVVVPSWLKADPKATAAPVIAEEPSDNWEPIEKPHEIAPDFCKVLNRHQDFWPTFTEKKKIKALVIEWQKEAGFGAYLRWGALFIAINTRNGWQDNDPRAWNMAGWYEFLAECEAIAHPEKVAARAKERAELEARRVKRQAEADAEQARRRHELEIWKRKAAENKRKRAALKALKKKRTNLANRIRIALGCGRTRAYEIADNGTKKPDQQIILAAAFKDDPERCTPEAWSRGKSQRYGRSLKAFLAVGGWAFEPDIAADCRLLTKDTKALNHVRSATALNYILKGMGGTDAYAVWSAYLRWQDQMPE
jgi:hypothetical protein